MMREQSRAVEKVQRRPQEEDLHVRAAILANCAGPQQEYGCLYQLQWQVEAERHHERKAAYAVGDHSRGQENIADKVHLHMEGSGVNGPSSPNQHLSSVLTQDMLSPGPLHSGSGG